MLSHSCDNIVHIIIGDVTSEVDCTSLTVVDLT